ncbi:MAG: pyruvate kinase [Verrucomicrobia bacterium]|nr:pyruvate kinase [Verrucomicrobiota bacterium]
MSQNFALEIQSIVSRLQPIRLEVLQAEQHFRKELDHVYPGNLQSARNLVHYLSLRRHDIRELQEDLGRLALSSLGRLESHVLATLDALMALLHKLSGENWDGRVIEETFADFDSGAVLLEKHTVESLGEAPAGRNVRIMVTMPSAAADDPRLVRNFLYRGMNIMRINCAHDSPPEWLRMVENLRAAQKETGKACKIAFDLAGPKLRTGPVSPSPGFIRWKPVRNQLGQVTRSAYIAFCSENYPFGGDTIAIPVKGSIFRHARAGYTIELTDTRGRARTLVVVEVDESSCICTNDRTGYVIQGTKLQLFRGKELLYEDEVGGLPEVEHSISLSAGDDLLLTPVEVPGKSAEYEEDEIDYRPAQIGCSLSAVFNDANPGERIFFDDGKIEGVIRAVHKEDVEPRLEVKITNAANGTAKLRADKGVNLPDTKLRISALTPKDREDLEFATKYGDLVSLSFVRRPEDVAELIRELDLLGATETKIILKIENRAAVEALPRILLTAMSRPTVTTVMVARGDLGVEIGFERMAEIQEQILWICEAAHVPVIWATQVLESLVKRGLPSRAEVTDAAMSGRAECVMLNKGPHILLALDFLCDVLLRMESHQAKKSALMRKLSVAEMAWK